MSNSFDPYHRWLGIPPKDQPPNHYRLLGVELFGSDLDVIATAADRQATYVKAHQTGEHADESQRILNELAAARVCLLDPDRKARYDDALTSGRPPTSEIYSIQQDEALELPEQPEDESPLAAKILDAGEPGPEEMDDRVEEWKSKSIHRKNSGFPGRIGGSPNWT